MVNKFFNKKSAATCSNKFVDGSAKYIPNQQLADRIHKPIIKKFKRRKVYSSFNPIRPGLLGGIKSLGGIQKTTPLKILY